MVYELAKAQHDAAVAGCEQERPQLESTIRTDMDQIITSKEHLASKIRGTALQGCTGMWGCAHGSWGGCSRGAAQLLAPLAGCTSSQEVGDKVGSHAPGVAGMGSVQTQGHCARIPGAVMKGGASCGRGLGTGAAPSAWGGFRV